MGSDCSLITTELVQKLKFPKSHLPQNINLQGFSSTSNVTVTDCIFVSLVLDNVSFENVKFYVVDNLTGCDVLIGRNVTEDPSVMYVRVGEILKFEKIERVSTILSNEYLNLNVAPEYNDELKKLFD